jgi:hypothetical protein
MEVLIALDDNGDTEGPVYDGPKDEPVWSLFSNDTPGPYWGVGEDGWNMSCYGSGLTYQGAVDLMHELGLHGDQLGT